MSTSIKIFKQKQPLTERRGPSFKGLARHSKDVFNELLIARLVTEPNVNKRNVLNKLSAVQSQTEPLPSQKPKATPWKEFARSKNNVFLQVICSKNSKLNGSFDNSKSKKPPKPPANLAPVYPTKTSVTKPFPIPRYPAKPSKPITKKTSSHALNIADTVISSQSNLKKKPTFCGIPNTKPSSKQHSLTAIKTHGVREKQSLSNVMEQKLHFSKPKGGRAPKCCLVYKPLVMKEITPELLPQTNSKYKTTRRLRFSRRPCMSKAPLLIIYFEGVVGDVICPFLFSPDAHVSYSLRPRYIEAFTQMTRQYQIVLISCLPFKRYATILNHLQSMYDAAYIDTRKEQYKIQDYTQILKDFCISSSNTLVVGSFDSDPSEKIDEVVANVNMLPMYGTDVPVTLLVPHVQWDRKINTENILTAINKLYGGDLSTLAGKKEGCGFDWGFSALSQGTEQHLILISTDKVYENMKHKYEVDKELLKHYEEVIRKRKNVQSPVVENNKIMQDKDKNMHTPLEAELFVEFKKTSMGVYDCFQIANHNASLIKTYYAKLSAAASELTEPDSIKKTKQFINYWESTIETAKAITNKIAILTKPYNKHGKVRTLEPENIMAEPFVCPYLNIATFTQKRLNCEFGSKKSSCTDADRIAEGNKIFSVKFK